MRYHALTYDDEAFVEVDDEECKEGKNGKSQSFKIEDIDSSSNNTSVPDAIVTDDGESDGDNHLPLLSFSSSDHHKNSSVFRSSTPTMFAKLKVFDQVPIKNGKVITSLAGKMSEFNEALGVVAMYCMATAPHDAEVADKTLKVLKSCNQLENEFDLYRSALRPESTNPLINDVVHDFKVFSVNCLQQFLSEFRLLDKTLLDDQEVSALRHSTSLWVESLEY